MVAGQSAEEAATACANALFAGSGLIRATTKVLHSSSLVQGLPEQAFGALGLPCSNTSPTALFCN